ncbi:hypothetical protein [Tropicimonas marinistellae]|uniref:hypothetical protein n=1 Tax=Tropicimonas marinistellae TaxID=1739787 RepID=UPI0008377C00|nr:hypothetical protein [Tropicimonas marinistellae]
MPDLVRMKPEPIPEIHPVPEYEAEGDLADVYARTKEGLGVPWMGVVTMAFAHYPTFYARLWSGLEPILSTEAFARACLSLRAIAEREAERLAPAPLVPRLKDMGYDPREMDDIRSCNEVFSAGNMPYVLIATLARILLEGQSWSGNQSIEPRRDVPEVMPRPALIEAHHADPTIAALYADIRETLGLPFVNTDYRAFARWPSYFAIGWSDLKAVISSPAYDSAVERVHDAAVDLARTLPNATGLTPEDLSAAASRDGAPGEVLAVVRLFQWLLPGLITNVAFLRHQLRGDWSG